MGVLQLSRLLLLLALPATGPQCGTGTVNARLAERCHCQYAASDRSNQFHLVTCTR